MTADLPTPAAAPADDGELRSIIFRIIAEKIELKTAPEDAMAFMDCKDVTASLVSFIHARDERRDAALRATITEISAELVEAERPLIEGENIHYWKEACEEEHQNLLATERCIDGWKAGLAAMTERAQVAEARCAELEAAQDEAFRKGLEEAALIAAGFDHDRLTPPEVWRETDTAAEVYGTGVCDASCFIREDIRARAALQQEPESK